MATTVHESHSWTSTSTNPLLGNKYVLYLLEVGTSDGSVHGVQQSRPANVILERLLGGHHPARKKSLRVKVALHRRILGLVAPVPDLGTGTGIED